jgi:hypothetical protein
VRPFPELGYRRHTKNGARPFSQPPFVTDSAIDGTGGDGVWHLGQIRGEEREPSIPMPFSLIRRLGRQPKVIVHIEERNL